MERKNHNQTHQQVINYNQTGSTNYKPGIIFTLVYIQVIQCGAIPSSSLHVGQIETDRSFAIAFTRAMISSG